MVVSWTGDADVDVFVEEPSGTICSYRNPRTTSGGVMLGDSAQPGSKLPAQGFSETYVCPQAFSGQYRILVRRVWGKVTAGKVNVDIYTHFGTKDVAQYHEELAVGEDDSVGVFQLADGRRQESLDERRVATAVAGQVALKQAMVNQVLNYTSQSSSAGTELAESRAKMAAMPIIPTAVGYQPVIQNFPTGAMMTVSMAVISADRRYVRITSMPFFSQIGQVSTFNTMSGAQGRSSSGVRTAVLVARAASVAPVAVRAAARVAVWAVAVWAVAVAAWAVVVHSNATAERRLRFRRPPRHRWCGFRS